MKAPTISLIAILSFAQTHLAGVHLDPEFQAGLSGTVHAVTTLEDGSILAGGEFGSHLAKLNPDGSLQSAFGADAPVHTLATANGMIYAGGRFGATIGSASPGISGSVDCLAVDSQGRAVIGGSFFAPALYLARLLPSGEIDASFTSDLRGSIAMEAGVSAVAIQPDGKVLAGGVFETGHGPEYLVRLNADGSLDSSFAGDPGSILYTKALLPLANGQCFVAGQGRDGKGFVRLLNADRSIDPSFSAPGFSGAVHTLALGAKGKLLVGGAFSGGTARLNADGSADASWNLSLNGPVNALAIDSEGRILAGGAFENGVARIIDSSLNPFATNENVFRAALQGEAGKQYVIETSTNLSTWTEFGTGTGTAGGVQVVDPQFAASAKRFFRARQIQ